MLNKYYKKFIILIISLILGLNFSTIIPANISDECHINKQFLENIEDESNQESNIFNINNSNGGLIITYENNKINHDIIKINNKDYLKLYCANESHTLEEGYPDLPKICRSIIVDNDKKFKITKIETEVNEFDNILLTPSKGISYRCNSLNITNKYLFSNIYHEDLWYPNKIVEISDSYILRDFKGQIIKINPVQYNPVQKTLRVYKLIKVNIIAVEDDDKPKIKRNFYKTISNDFYKIYNKHFMNFDSIQRNISARYPDKMLIICHDDFYNILESFVNWKREKGLPTSIINVSEIGGTSTDIKNYVYQEYINENITYLLLVGDNQQIPTIILNGYASDPSYSFLDGNDYYPEIFVGRLSAQTISQVQTMIERIVSYEKTPLINNSYYLNATGVASTQGPGDNNEFDWQHMRKIRDELLNYTYVYVDELYDGSHNEFDMDGNPTRDMVKNCINSGSGLINYCGHGSSTSWTTSGFNVNDINSLSNKNMYPFVISVACLNGNFINYNECFCESWIRSKNEENEPTGAIAATGSSISMSWEPPMRAQDKMIELITENNKNQTIQTIGGIHTYGCINMNDVYGSYGEKETSAWHIFGDPSVTLRTLPPTIMNVSHNIFITYDEDNLTIKVNNVSGAICSISQNNNWIVNNITDMDGNAVIELKNKINISLPIKLVITALNKIPYITNIDYIDLKTNLNASFSYYPKNPTINTLINFIDNSSINIGNIVNWTWDFGDGNLSYEKNPIHQYNKSGNYDISLTITDSFGLNDSNIKIIEIKNFKIINISLCKGWNLVTMPIDTNIMASSLAENITSCISVVGWNSSSQSYWFYLPGFPAFDFPLQVGHGYFVEMSGNETLAVTGLPIDNVNVSLFTGWNLIGWYENDDTSASSIYENITDCKSVVKWDPIDQSYWFYIPGFPAFDFVVYQGMALYVGVTSDSIWHGGG
ncbi:C25 family cysteine peptidase [Thermoplasmatota archaeon]